MSTPISIVRVEQKKKMNKKESYNPSKVTNLIQRYEELTKTNCIRPFLRRWMSTNSTNVDPTGSKSSIAQRLDKVGIPRNKPCGYGHGRNSGISGSNDNIGRTANEEVKFIEINGPNTTQTSIFQKNSKSGVTNHIDHMKSSKEFRIEAKQNPLKTARSIEDFEEFIYFDEVTKEKCEINVGEENAIFSATSHTDHVKSNKEAKRNPLKTANSIEEFEEQIYFDEVTNEKLKPSYEINSGDVGENTIELARERAKAEEEKYRKSFIEALENYEDIFIQEDTEIDDKNTEAEIIEIDDKNTEAETIEIDDKNTEAETIVVNEEIEDGNNAEVKSKVKKDKKEFVVDELLSSERIYIQNLELVIKHYLQYLKQQKYDSDTIKTIFSNIESIHEHSQIFLLHLEGCNYNYAEIGKVFCKHRELFDKYPKYCRERNRSYNMITTDLKLIVAHRQLKLEDKLGLNSSLLKPIQRLAKYELLLINLNNILQEEGTNIASIQNAITLIQRTARIADTMVILSKIVRCPYNYNDIGHLILQDEFKLLNPEKIDTTVFLFGRMLIFTEKAIAREEFNYRHSIPIDALRFNRPKNSSILILENYSNKIRKPISIYTLETKDSKILNAWFKEINQILWKQLETFKGNAQRKAFTSSLNHFKSIDKVDKPSKIVTNGKPNKNPVDSEKHAEVVASNKKQTKVTTIKQNIEKSSNKNRVENEKHVKVVVVNKKPTKVTTVKQNIEKPSSPKHLPSTKSTQKKQVKSSDKERERERERKKNIDRKMAMIHRM